METKLADAVSTTNTTATTLEHNRPLEYFLLAVQEVGSLLIVVPNLYHAFSLKPAGYEKAAKEAGLPSPKALGMLFILVNILGSVLLIVGPLIPHHVADFAFGTHHSWTLSSLSAMSGAFMLLFALLAQTYAVPITRLWKTEDEAEKMREVAQLLKNIGIMGGFFVILSTCSVVGNLPFRQDIIGRVLACVPVVCLSIRFGPKGFKNYVEDAGLKPAALFGLCGFITGVCGPLCVIVARFLPGEKVVSRSSKWQTMASSVGAGMVVIHLIAATILRSKTKAGDMGSMGVGTRVPSNALDDVKLRAVMSGLKNISLIGVQLLILASSFKGPTLEEFGW